MGIFPWSSEPAVTWWCPDPRAIFELDSFRVPRSLRKQIRQSGWTFHLDRDFEGTMRRCAEPAADRPSTWISEDFIVSYSELHRRGIAHSVEVCEGEEVVGGLYGVAIGGFFGGESMFRRRSNASKAAVAHLVAHLRARGFALLDAQVMTPHLASLGAIEIRRAEFLRRLGEAMVLPVTF
jgi:leucyl/phenylalanyl-tRNA--protein transferase